MSLASELCLMCGQYPEFCPHNPIKPMGCLATTGGTAPADSTEALLNGRQKTHGEFADHARATCAMKAILRDEGYLELPPIHREALDMIVHKIGRILSGNPNHHDHWDDIAGYAKLVSQRIPPLT